MIVIFNNLGLIMALIGAAISLAAAWLSPDNFYGSGPLALGLVFLCCDIVYRLKYGQRRMIHWRHGGQLFFVPIWVWGILCLFIGTKSLSQTLHERQEIQQHQQRLHR